MKKNNNSGPRELRERLLGHFQVLRIPVSSEQLEAVLAEAERQRWSHLEFLNALIGEQADRRRERSIERRIQEAKFRENRALEAFDWQTILIKKAG